MIAKAMDTFQQNIKKLGMSMLSYFGLFKNHSMETLEISMDYYAPFIFNNFL